MSQASSTRGQGPPSPLFITAVLLATTAAWAIQPNATATDVVYPNALGDAVSDHFSFVYNNKIYTLGGYNGTETDRVVIFDPANNTTIAGTPLPYGVRGHAGVWTGEMAYIFGGFGLPDPGGNYEWTQHIVRYDPSTGNSTVLEALLPHGGSQMAAAWDGERAYLLGGRGNSPGCGPGYGCTTIYVFDPSLNVVQTASSALPKESQHATAAFHDGYVYQFGGNTREPVFSAPLEVSDEILRYNTSTGGIEILNVTLPIAAYISALETSGRYMYLSGGVTGADFVTNVTRFDPSSLSTKTFPQPDHVGRASHQIVALGGTLYEVGGSQGAGPIASVEALHIDDLTNVTFTTTPSSVSPGERFQVCWQVSGIGDVDHTDVHWVAPIPIGSSSSTTPDQVGVAPGDFCASITTPLAATSMHVTAHASGPNDDIMSATASIPVQV